MTDAERIKLLKEVARVAPEEMGAVFCYVGALTRASASTGDYAPNAVALASGQTLWLKNDIEDAPGCFALLDAMEGAGYEVTLKSSRSLTGSTIHYACWLLSLHNGRPVVIGDGAYFGASLHPTRAEALARAFVQVFPAPAPSASPPSRPE